MFNLLMVADPDAWKGDPIVFDASRAIRANEYTVKEIAEKYDSWDDATIDQLKSYPCLFAIEGDSSPTYLGWITDIKRRSGALVVSYSIDPTFVPLPPGALGKLGVLLDLSPRGFELNRTHWALKEVDLYQVLADKGYVTKEKLVEIQKMPGVTKAASPAHYHNKRVFVVHGHDDQAKEEVESFLFSLGLEPIVLHRQASSSMTIIEKIERFSDVGFAVVLYTPCDMGAKYGDLQFQYRARQNVVFEHGYFVGKLGRDRVASLKKSELDTPNDISGIVYIEFESPHVWQSQLVTELKAAGYLI